MTFVHSCGNLGLLLSGYVLDRRCDLRCIIEMGEPVLPWAILLHMPLDVLFVRDDDMPRTATGKILHRVLKARYSEPT